MPKESDSLRNVRALKRRIEENSQSLSKVGESFKEHVESLAAYLEFWAKCAGDALASNNQAYIIQVLTNIMGSHAGTIRDLREELKSSPHWNKLSDHANVQDQSMGNNGTPGVG